MADVASIRARYGAAFARLAPEGGQPHEVRGDGGGLVAAVEALGVSHLAASLALGDHLRLVDDGVQLELHREGHEAKLRVVWTDGPSFEARIPVPVPPPVAASSAGPVGPRLEGSALVAALLDPKRALSVGRGGVYDGLHADGLVGIIPAVLPDALGSVSFRRAHGVRASLMAGAMAGGIASPELVIAMSKAGLLAVYGAGGLPLHEVGAAVVRITDELGDKPVGFNLLHNPIEPAVEEATVDVYLAHGVRTVEASAFMGLTPAIVRFRFAGIAAGPDGEPVVRQRVLAKVSRSEVAEKFLRPPPAALLAELVASGFLTEAQALLAARLPVAEDITAEADSGGHTDGRPLVVLLPTLQRLRDRIVAEEGYAERGISPRIGAAGGLGDPQSVHAAFAMGADYVLTGTVNQTSIEAGTSRLAKEMLADAGMADCSMGPAPDMFEIGAHVQVLGRGSMYAQRAGRLYELYRTFPSLDAIPDAERQKVEKTIFQRTFDDVWAETESYWARRDPRELERAAAQPRHKMALVFRWYLGMTSRWARQGAPERKRDFQIWCGPAIGLFNDWVAGSWLQPLDARGIVAISDALLHGAAVQRRLDLARLIGVALPPGVGQPPPHRA